ncbi:acetyltransferas-like protein [Plenodomus tracheiphilus IPT5]|uniref:Acetyltransferas-like protein n=1 Tax=Plenodomus tracheiphilus IPT5 TaxID=1408161 RepID=A0A6A7BLN6_9PLEO|nr:acetyltransferas-like protein [Plenodomus tracheiphilus IPT5]
MEVYEHDASSPILLKALKASLPFSVPLLYRTQHANRTEDAHIIATFSPTAGAVPGCWAAAYLDRSKRPETELWIFAAGEDPDHSLPKEFCSGCRISILSLLDYMSTIPVPPMHQDNTFAMDLAEQHAIEHPTPGNNGRYALSLGTYMRHLLYPGVVTLGTCHHSVMQVCHEAGVVRAEFPGPNAELNKFLFKISNLPETRDLPKGLRWGRVREQDINIVKARTSIPRSTRTLLSLESLGVFDEASGTIVAWAFIGLDGSLTTLHTEAEYRGKGIAKAVAANVIKQYAGGSAVDERGEAWSHADVYTDNVQSEIVCRSLGGKAMWKCFWLRIDLAAAGSLAYKT